MRTGRLWRREPGDRCAYLEPGVLQRPGGAYLVTSVTAFAAPIRDPVHWAQVAQLEAEVRSFTHSDDVVDLASVGDTADHGVLADVAPGTVCGVHQEAYLLPPVPAASHRAGARRLNRHTIMIEEENMTSFTQRVAEAILNDAQSGSAVWDELNGPSAELRQETETTFTITIPQEYSEVEGESSLQVCVITVKEKEHP